MRKKIIFIGIVFITIIAVTIIGKKQKIEPESKNFTLKIVSPKETKKILEKRKRQDLENYKPTTAIDIARFKAYEKVTYEDGEIKNWKNSEVTEEKFNRDKPVTIFYNKEGLSNREVYVVKFQSHLGSTEFPVIFYVDKNSYEILGKGEKGNFYD
ncbi:hypothetical protein [Clostridium felsineum]|uniref:Uncharacterized protein n=1 Tax=Clostridium felsineum TaxID=36839 RepID=A0A1S8M954_9CLOT|nr:hypothetical protein [Clostridium felsineum]URZ07379.1 hypothetical protein CLROS_027170 [Clostridium felsineum]URZ12410.1 hypothetical protein CROST_031320 [Clostridium felsineum]